MKCDSGTEAGQLWSCKTHHQEQEKSIVDKIKAFFRCFPQPPPSKQPQTQKTRDRRRHLDRWSFLTIFGVTCLAITFLVCIGGTIVMWFTDLYLDQILRQMTLRKGSEVFEAWSSPPVKPLICAYVFNYTNVERYAKKLDPKIHVQEVGPYCYRETQRKKNITFNDDDTVTYGDQRIHQFEPGFSNGTQDDILIVPNLPLISLMAICKDLNKVTQFMVSSFLKGYLKYSNTMVKVRAHDLFFGYDDKLFDVMKKVAKMVKKDIPFEKFGLLSSRAANTDETVTVLTGNADLTKIGVVTEVNGADRLDVWSDEECNRIDGSDGAFFPRSTINESATLYLFHKDLCRKMPFVFDKEVEFQDGVMGMRFHAAPTVYDTNGTCFCPKTGCAPNGVFDLSPCTSGTPVMMSFPHFLYADESVREPFVGLHPDPKKHEFYIDIQGLLGFTLGTVSRLQLNMKIHWPSGMKFLKEFRPGTILPVVWIQVSAERLPPKLYNYIYHSSVTVKVMQTALRWFTLAASIAFGGIIIYILMRRSKSKTPQSDIKKGQDEPMMQMTDR